MREKNTPVTVLLWILTLICLAGTLTRWVPAQWESIPAIPFIASLSAWFIVPILIVFILGLYFHSGSVLVALVICLVLQGVAIVPNLGNSPTELSAATREYMADSNDSKKARDSDQMARIMTLDVALGKADPQEVVNMVRDRGVEVLALQRTTTMFNNSLRDAGINELLPNLVSSDSTQGNMNSIYTLGAITDPSTAAIHGTGANAPGATITFKDNKRIRFINVYVDAPQDVNAEQWCTELNEINDWAVDHMSDGMPYVIMGNFGAMFYQHHFSQILENAGYRDAGMVLKKSMTFTWPSTVPMATYDHIVVNGAVNMGNMEISKISGTDHKAVLVIIETNDVNLLDQQQSTAVPTVPATVI